MASLAIGCSLGLVCIFIALVWVIPARADVGPEPIMPGGSSLKPEDKTPIEMQAEKVAINIRKATEADNAMINFDPQWYGYDFYDVWYPAVAEVEAEFSMNNPTSEKVNMTVWFPLASVLKDERWESRGAEIVPSIKRFQVIVKGKAVDYSVSELPNPQGGDSPPLPWASFPVTFPPKEKVKIKVSYVVPAERPESKSKGLIMDFHYIFQTGAGWAGPIGKAELEVNLPYPASPETIVKMPEGGKVNGNRVRWSWENFEPGPANDFSISLMQLEPWENLKADRVAVRANPRDGQAWVGLCDTYYWLSYSGWYKNPGLGEIYPALGLEACQEAARLLSENEPRDGQAWLDLCAIYYRPKMDKPSDLSVSVQACQAAARLLPEDAAPHYGLAVLYLSELPDNPAAEKLQPVLDELKLGQELEAIQPASDKASFFVPMLYLDAPPADLILEWIDRIAPVPKLTAKHPTEIRQSAATSTPRPATATVPTQKSTLPPTQKLTQIAGSLPSETLNGPHIAYVTSTATATAPTAATEPAATTPARQGLILGAIAVLVVVIYLVLSRMLGRANR